MKELIKIINQGPDLMADSRDISKLFGIQHESLRKLIEDHQAQLVQLGVFRFEIGKSLPNTQGRPDKFCYLNFDQIAFLLTVSRPTEETKEFRLRLIIAFRAARGRLRPVDKSLLTIPTEWKRTFPEDLYVALMRLYGAEFDKTVGTPGWVGKWTNKFIYEPLYNGLPNELKQRRRLHVGEMGSEAWLKLHQFIEKHAKENLKKHLIKVTTLLEVARNPRHFIELFVAAFGGGGQLLLGSDNEFA